MAAQQIAEPTVYVVAIDVSESAKDVHESLFNRMVSHMEEMPRGARMIVFRFDSVAQEVYDGDAILDAQLAGEMMEPEMRNRRSNTSGTNLARLFDRIDGRISGLRDYVRIDVFTDCGTEEMTTGDDDRVRDLTSRWGTAGNIDLVFQGVSTGHREKVRSIIQMPVEIR